MISKKDYSQFDANEMSIESFDKTINGHTRKDGIKMGVIDADKVELSAIQKKHERLDKNDTESNSSYEHLSSDKDMCHNMIEVDTIGLDKINEIQIEMLDLFFYAS